MFEWAGQVADMFRFLGVLRVLLMLLPYFRAKGWKFFAIFVYLWACSIIILNVFNDFWVLSSNYGRFRRVGTIEVPLWLDLP